MIKVDRSRVEVPKILTQNDDGKQKGGKLSAEKEQRLARESLEKWKNEGKDVKDWSFDFKIYKHDQVKQALKQLFHGKCAYCESRYAVTQPMDVEHWRPKGRIERENSPPKKPGYYWLASKWENLLPSCIDCNRERKQKDAVTGDTLSLGKKDKFPLVLEAVRAEIEGDEARETPLLLDPCDKDPSLYLEFKQNAVISPKSADGLDRRIAETSIQVYGLNRSDLVLNREELLQLLKLKIMMIKSLSRLLIDHPDLPESVVTVIEDLILKEMQALTRAKKDDQRYSLLARQIIDKNMKDFEPPG